MTALRHVGMTVFWAVGMAGVTMGADGIDHREVMWFVGADGGTRPVTSVAEWGQRRAAVVKGMEAVMGALPREERKKLGPVEVVVKEVVRREGYRRETVEFSSLYGEKVTAYLYRPEGLKEGERRPGVLSLHSTGAEGKVIVDGAGPKGPRLGFAAEMARRGWVVVAPDYPSFGEQKGYDFAKSPFASGTMKAVCDNMRCLDLLTSLPEVDAAKLGAVGHSLGGHNALFTAAFDERIRVAVTSCGWTPFHDYYGGKKLANWAQQRYMPWVVSVYAADADRMPFDFAEVIAAVAPRAVWSNSPVGDENFDVAGVRKGEAEARKVFALYGMPARFAVTHPNYGHEFGEAERGRAWAFMETVWGGEVKLGNNQ